MSDDATPRLGLPYLAAGQAQKHVTLNEALACLDGLVQTAVVSRSVAAQPASPDDGALYILPADATGGVWAGEAEGALMRFEAGGWTRLDPAAGHLAWVADEASALVFGGATWTPLADSLRSTAATVALSASAAATRFAVLEEDVTLSGASTATVAVIPARSLVLAVSTRTIEAVTGASAYDCGVAGEASRFGGSLGVSAGASNIGVIGPTAFYADTPVVLTAVGGGFSGGTVRVAIHLVLFDAPAG